MHELNRLAYLDAMGIDSYLSRSQLPGAAASQRLVVVSQRGPVASDPQPTGSGQPVPGVEGGPTGHLPRMEGATSRSVEPPPQPVSVSDSRDTIPRFSLAAIVAGNWLWVEELAGMPLTREQVRLVQAMAYAVQQVAAANAPGVAGFELPRAEIAQFDWPIHNNQQLELGEEAARTALAGFLGRKIHQQGLGLVLLGSACGARVPVNELSCPQITLTHSSAEILASPLLKKRAWADVKSALRRN